MSDRFRTGELLAAIGAVALTVLLIFGVWFSYEFALPDGQNVVQGTVGAGHLGWFAVLVTGFAAAAGLVFLFRVLTSETSDRAVLQAPVAYVTALFALIVDAVRVFAFPPNVTLRPTEFAPNLNLPNLNLETDLASGGMLGLFALLFLVVGTWLSMADERKDTAAARLQTEALLAQSPIRPAPPAGVTDDSDADVVAQDQTGDSTEPATPPTGDSA